MELIVKFILSYLLGSISGSLLLGKIKKVDIRKMGSGNAGGTNAFRTMGGTFALGVLFVDILKGIISVKIIPFLKLGNILTTNMMNMEILSILCGIGAVLGHVYPVYHEFSGGKGVLTMVGILIVLFPMALAICLTMWFITLILTGYVGLGTTIACITLPICTFIFYPHGIFSPFGFFSVVVAIFIIFNHRHNISRMISGNENRFYKIMIFSGNKK